MTKNEYKQSAYYLIYLIKCVLSDKIPSKTMLDKMNLSSIFAVAHEHSLTAMAAYALESAGIVDERFKEAKGKAVRKTILFEVECSAVLAELEKAGIWYVPLKGNIIKDYYPKSSMREMADIDILCDEYRMSDVKECMESLGFITKSFEHDNNQDVYHKPPVCSFEMHKSLLHPKYGSTRYYYYKNIKKKLIKDNDNGFGYHFKDEDFYLYFITHEYNHFIETGTGIRSLVDTYIIIKRFYDTFDKKFLDVEFQKLGISDFEKANRSLTMKLFDGEYLTEKDKALLNRFIFSGTYGTFEGRIINADIDSGIISKIKYAYNRIKLPEELLKEYYPFFYKHKILRPLFYSKRLIHKALYDSTALKSEIRELLRYKR